MSLLHKFLVWGYLSNKQTLICPLLPDKVISERFWCLHCASQFSRLLLPAALCFLLLNRVCRRTTLGKGQLHGFLGEKRKPRGKKGCRSWAVDDSGMLREFSSKWEAVADQEAFAFGSLHPAVTLASQWINTADIQWYWPQPRSPCQTPSTPVKQIPFTQLSANISAVAGDMLSLPLSYGC